MNDLVCEWHLEVARCGLLGLGAVSRRAGGIEILYLHFEAVVRNQQRSEGVQDLDPGVDVGIDHTESLRVVSPGLRRLLLFGDRVLEALLLQCLIVAASMGA